MEERRPDADGLYPSFEPLNFHDSPSLILSRLFEGDLNWDTWRRTFFDPTSLSPEERGRFTDAMKDAIGRSSIGDSLIDVATNPFVWLMFVTTPGGMTAVREGGKVFGGGAKAFLGWAGQDMKLLKALNLLSAEQQYANTSIPTTLHFFARNKERLRTETGAVLDPVVGRLLQRLSDKFGVKVTSLDPERASNPTVRRFLEDMNLVVEGRLRGLDEFTSRSSVRPVVMEEAELIGGRKVWVRSKDMDDLLSERGRSPSTSRTIESFDRKGDSFEKRSVDESPIASGNRESRRLNVEASDRIEMPMVEEGSLARWIAREGADEYVDALEKVMQDRLVRMYFDEEALRTTGRYVVDKEKAVRTMRTALDDYKERTILSGVHGISRSENLMLSDEVMALYQKDPDGFMSRIDDVVRATYLNRSGGLIGRREGLMRPNSIDLKDRGGTLFDPSVAYQKSGSGRVEDVRVTASGDMHSDALRSRPMTFDEDDLVRLHDLSGSSSRTSRLADEIERIAKVGRDFADDLDSNQAPYRRVQRLNAQRSMRRFLESTEDVWVRGSIGVDEQTRSVLRRFPYEGRKLGKGETQTRMPFLDVPPPAKAPGLEALSTGKDWRDPLGGLRIEDVLRMQVDALERSGNKDGARYLTNVLVPMIRGRLNKRHYATLAVMHQMQKASRWLAESPVGRTIRSSGSFGSATMDRLLAYADRPLRYSDAGALSSNVAGLYYSSLMGLSVPTVLLNMMQPMLFAGSWMGYSNVLEGYGEAFRRLGAYGAARMRHGLRIDSATKKRLIEEHLDPDGVLELSDDVMDSIDSLHRSAGPKGAARFWLQEMPLKGFEKAEWMNRLVTRSAYRRMMRKVRGRDPVGDEVAGDLDDFRRILSNTQYTVSAESVPQFMAGTSDESSFLGRAFTNPMVRQFLQFPTRTTTGLLASTRIVGGGRREVPFMGVKDLGGFASLYDLTRMIGASAILYEGARAAFDADMSRGLAPSVFTDVVGGDRFLRPGESVADRFVPPALGVPLDLVKGVLGGEYDEVRSALWRFLPGGLAGSRLANILPPIPVVGPMVQKTYADWANPLPDGSIGVYDQSGRMTELRGGAGLVLQGLGLDMNRHRSDQELSAFLLRNRDRYKEAQRQAMSRMLSNDMAGAKAVQAEWEQKTGIPLRISRGQLDMAIQNRDRPTIDRIRGSLPRDLESALRGEAIPAFGSDLGS